MEGKFMIYSNTDYESQEVICIEVKGNHVGKLDVDIDLVIKWSCDRTIHRTQIISLEEENRQEGSERLIRQITDKEREKERERGKFINKNRFISGRNIVQSSKGQNSRRPV